MLFIARDAPQYAQLFATRVFRATDGLEDFSQMGRVVPEIEHDDIREVIVQNYRIIYRFLPDELEFERWCWTTPDHHCLCPQGWYSDNRVVRKSGSQPFIPFLHVRYRPNVFAEVHTYFCSNIKVKLALSFRFAGL